MPTRDTDGTFSPLRAARRARRSAEAAFDPDEPRLERRIRTLGLSLGVEILDVDETVVEAVNGWDGTLSTTVEALWRQLVHDPCPHLRLHAAVALGDMLIRVDPLSATWLVSSWASAEEKPLRLAIARALHCPVQIVGALWALEHLAEDGVPIIRAAAKGALRVRLGKTSADALHAPRCLAVSTH